MNKSPESIKEQLKEKFKNRRQEIGDTEFISISDLKLDIHPDTYEEYRRLNGYYDEIIKDYDTTGLNKNKEVFELLGNPNDLLIKLFYVASKLDYAYLEAIQTGGKSSFTGEQYDELNDVLVEVEEYLGIE